MTKVTQVTKVTKVTKVRSGNSIPLRRVTTLLFNGTLSQRPGMYRVTIRRYKFSNKQLLKLTENYFNQLPVYFKSFYCLSIALPGRPTMVPGINVFLVV